MNPNQQLQLQKEAPLFLALGHVFGSTVKSQKKKKRKSSWKCFYVCKTLYKCFLVACRGIAHLLLPLNAHGVICIATRSNFLNTFPRQFWDIASFGFDPFLNGSSLAWAKVTNFQRSESFAFANDMNVFSNGCYHLQIITIKD